MKMRAKWWIVSALFSWASGLSGCATREVRTDDVIWRVNIVAEHPHDSTAFTQGLAIYSGQMYEGTGRYGFSSLRRVDVVTGTIEQMVSLDGAHFGEGITVLDNRIYQFTWRNNIAFVYDPDTFTVLATLRYDREAWGVTNDGTHLIVSDGSATIRFLDPGTLESVRHITAHTGTRVVASLNELEYVNDEIWANIWYKDRIARISPVDGEILGWIDFSEPHPHRDRNAEDVMNGIAFDAVSGRVFVTGKNWPRLYEIEVMRLSP